MMRHSLVIYLFTLILLACHGSNASPYGIKRVNGFDIPISPEKHNFTAASSNTIVPFNQQLALGLATQTNAVKELVAISQPSSVRNIQYLQNYVYDDRAGRGSWVYHLEAGVNFRKLSAVSGPAAAPP
ncbi:hypothetical protein GE09DRAFT_613775 [Coniochaeta sp. 2T2.1]|nr:hypothetical protein GE09DRAFT_613775 [Coniochaeta sp. 2T2.1]